MSRKSIVLLILLENHGKYSGCETCKRTSDRTATGPGNQHAKGSWWMFKNQLSLIPYNVIFDHTTPPQHTHTSRIHFWYPSTQFCVDFSLSRPTSIAQMYWLWLSEHELFNLSSPRQKCPISGFPKAPGSCPNTLEEQVPEEDRLAGSILSDTHPLCEWPQVSCLAPSAAHCPSLNGS